VLYVSDVKMQKYRKLFLNQQVARQLSWENGVA